MSYRDVYRLADSTAIEPLINNWAVWSDLIAPVPYSMHLLHYQIKLLSSYLDNPEIHVKACQNPKFSGGSFVNIPVTKVNEVKKILEITEEHQSENIKLAKAITEFYDFLNKEAQGQSIEPFYQKIPDVLRGYIELVYDHFNHPIIRFIENLLYESHYYHKNLQSLRIFKQIRDDSRYFFLNTPRLLDSDEIDWVVPFNSSQVDEFFQIERNPQPFGYICEILGLSSNEELRLLPLLSQAPIPVSQKWDGSGVRIRYFGHACVLVEWNGISILIDPWIGVLSKEREVEHLSYKDIPEKIDFALITHGHHDHFVLESLLRLRHKIECLVVPKTFGIFYTDPSLKLMAHKMGFKHVIEMESFESIKLPDGEIIGIPFLGEHADLAHGKTGYIVRAGKEQILFAADSNCLDKRIYEHIRRILGPIETVFLGMECVGAPLSWLYGALLPVKLSHNYDKSRRTKGCNSDAALDLLEAVGSKRVYIYAMGNEPWLQHGMGLGLSKESLQIKESNKVLLKAREKGFISAERPFGNFELHLGCK